MAKPKVKKVVKKVPVWRKKVPKADFKSRPKTAGQCRWEDKIPGSVIGTKAHTVVMSAAFFNNGFGRREWLLNIGQSTSGAHHWLWNNHNKIQFGRWNGAQAQRANIRSVKKAIATVYDGKTYKLFIDGKKVATVKINNMNIKTNRLMVGVKPINEADFKGCVYGVNIYKKALSDKEVEEATGDIDNDVDKVKIVKAKACSGDDCTSTAQCPSRHSVVACASEPANGGDGIQVSNSKCMARGSHNRRAISAVATCSPERNTKVSVSNRLYLDRQTVKATCAGGSKALNCYCTSAWTASVCGGQTAFKPSDAKTCKKAIGSSGGRRRNVGSGAGAKIYAVCA
jgi:hypothetical protein